MFGVAIYLLKSLSIVNSMNKIGSKMHIQTFIHLSIRLNMILVYVGLQLYSEHGTFVIRQIQQNIHRVRIEAITITYYYYDFKTIVCVINGAMVIFDDSRPQTNNNHCCVVSDCATYISACFLYFSFEFWVLTCASYGVRYFMHRWIPLSCLTWECLHSFSFSDSVHI